MSSGGVWIEPSRRVVFIATPIAINATVSDAVDLRSYALRGLVMPAAFTGTAMTFQACATVDGTFLAVVDDAAAAVSVTVAASKYIVFSAAVAEKLNACNFVRLVSGTAEAAARIVTLVGVASTK